MPRENAGLGDLVGRVVDEAVGLVSAEIARARAEIDERTQHGVALLVRASITLMLAALALQAFSVAAIIFAASVLGSYTAGSLVVGTIYTALAGAGALAVRRAAVLTAEPLQTIEGPMKALPGPKEETT